LSFLKKPYRFAVVYSIFLTCISAYVLLDAFVIPKAAVPVATAAYQQVGQVAAVVEPAAGGEPVLTDSSYRDENIQITIEKGRAFESVYYVADIRLSSADYLKTALAKNTYGRNITETTSEMAAAHNAVLAVNGDYYGFRNTGFVLRNGVLYRAAGKGQSGEALLIDAAGNFSIAEETTLSEKDLAGMQQVLSFGPGLVMNGESTVTGGGNARSQDAQSNPRTAIGQISELHYVVVVVDGRTAASRGVTLKQLAELMIQYNCRIAYNLDGGGSSAMVFNGQVINQPTDGRTVGERRVSDIVYFGHE
jgi:exopolysaccharide biosynthesis protein